ncbi:MAG TPA: hypothetical protein VHL11_24955, partial [Phototrophicaceae bacterium]|nr:hypothetical protein [Phototrophicaceae bacterium]
VWVLLGFCLSLGFASVYAQQPSDQQQPETTQEAPSTAIATQEPEPTQYYFPAWSPDGQTIAYTSTGGIYVMGRDGSNPRQITPTFIFEGWTPDSQAVIVNASYSQTDITGWWLYPIDGTEPQPFFPEFDLIYNVVYSDAGDQIVLSAQKTLSDPAGIWLAAIDAAGAVSAPVLIADTALNAYNILELHWTEIVGELKLKVSLKTTGKVFYIYLNTETASLPIQNLNSANIELQKSDDSLDLGAGWSLYFKPNQNTFSPAYYARRLNQPALGTLPMDGLITDIHLAPDGRYLFYVRYCSPDEVPASLLNGEWSSADQETVRTSLHLIELTDETGSTITGTDTTLIDCGIGSQLFPTFAPDASSLIYVTASETGWRFYWVDLVGDHALTPVDITPTE